MRSTGRGPRLGTKLLLLGLPLALLVPWLALVLLDELERLSVRMQANQQRLIAESIAISFNGREDWFTDLPVGAGGNTQTLVARPIGSAIRPRLDGAMGDWGRQPEAQRFGGGDGGFQLALGAQENTLYAYLEVQDDVRVYRNPEVLRLNNADQVRIEFIEPNGGDGRISVTLSEPGGTTAYRMDPDWRFAAGGLPESAVQGYLREVEAGYAVELRMPYALLGSWRLFGISVVDVDDPEGRAIRAVAHTGQSNLAAYRSPVLLKILEGLGYSDMQIRVIDTEDRIRAETGSYRTEAGLAERGSWLAAARQGLGGLAGREPRDATDTASAIAEEVRRNALAGQPTARRRRMADVETILAGHHIVSTEGDVIGMIAVEQHIDDILRFQYDAIDRIALVSLASLFLVPLCLVGFAGRLAWRIGALRREAAAAIDERGRLRAPTLESGAAAADEIGDLARTIASMLARLGQHNTFLKRMPRTLRHEINNPLNALNTSLEHLSEKLAGGQEDKYLDSAKRGILRIGAIVENLADAANLEESLTAEEMDLVDIEALLESYVGNCRSAHPAHCFVFRGTSSPAYALVADYRIEQLLDKLIDNAVDFHRAGSAIRIQLDTFGDQLRLVVANRGPLLPTEDAGPLFESMVSGRGAGANLHFGLGLYVVRVIAEQHGGTVRAVNLQDRSGVAVVVTLPLARARPGAISDSLAAP